MTTRTITWRDSNTRRLAMVLAAISLLVTVVLFSAFWAAERSDGLALDRQRLVVERAIAGARADVAREQSTVAVWDDPVVRLRAPTEEDLAWASENIGVWLGQTFGHDEVFILSGTGAPLYAVSDGARRPARTYLERGADLRRVVAGLRAQRDLDATTDIIRIDGRTALVGAAKIIPLTDRVARSRGHEPILVSVAFADTRLVGLLKQRNLLSGARFSRQDDAGPGEEAKAVVDAAGRTAGYMIWTPALPGRSVLLATLPLSLLAISIAVALLLWLLRDLARTARRMHEANLAKSIFLANMSHELRTPLNGMLAVAELLQARQTDGEARRMAELIVASGRHFEQLIGQVLDFSKIEAGKLELERRPFDFEACLNNQVALHRAAAAQRGLDIDIRATRGARGGFVGDETRVAQIVSNLLGNAIKFSRVGPVRVSARRIGGRLCVSVADRGEGIAAEDLRRIFNPFEQADATITRRFGGTGLGLSIASTLAELMGGRLSARSRVGVGSIFRFTAPLETTSVPTAVEVQTPAPGEDDAVSAPAGLRILLAEDHPANQQVVALILDTIRVDLTIVGDGQAALDALDEREFDLVLMDMQMPRLDGLSATRLLRARQKALGQRRTPVIALTANTAQSDVAACLAAGADLHIAKPLRPAALLEAIAGFAGRRGDQAAA